MNTRSPVLFMVFNRPDTTQRVFEAIRAARPPRLYVAADGPRTAREGEAQRCETTRRIATAVDWPCELITLFRTENLGCKRAVGSAITWFFEHEPEGIVLEDDCLPDASFFAYCDALLERYRDDPRVMCISGDNFISDAWKPEESYYFSIYTHIWGWASWRRAWKSYDIEMSDWKASDPRLLLGRKLPAERQAQRHWKSVFDRVAAGKIDTWDYQWNYACWKHDGVTCLPKVNLVSNIGFGADATHTVSPESKHANLAVAAIALPLQHPKDVAATALADRWTNKHVFGLDERPRSFVQWGRDLVRGLRKG
jgi:hypothetical protein